MANILRFSVIGLLISLSSSFTLLTFNLLAIPGAAVTGKELLEQLIISAILGIMIGLISLILETDYLNFTLLLIIHFIAVTICVLAAGYFGGWYDITNMVTMISLLMSIIIIYIISWGITILLLKRDIKEMNHFIQQKRKK